MVKLFLIQHGEAKTKDEDPAKPLTEHGGALVERMAAWAARAGVTVSEIRHSGQLRAGQTADILGRHLAPGRGVVAPTGLNPKDDVELLAQELAGRQESLMLVGHQSFLDRLVSRLDVGAAVRFSNAALVGLRRDAGKWSLVLQVTPELLATSEVASLSKDQQIALLTDAGADSVDRWNAWRDSDRDAKVMLAGANLTHATLEGANLSGADLRGADLSERDLGDARLTDAELRDAKLTNAKMKSVKGLQAGKLGGAVTTLAELPDEVKLPEALATVKDASANARKIFLAMQLGCAYAILTIATTTDVRLLTDSATSPLPIIQAQVSIVGFYGAAPLILLGFYLYFHLCMQNIWGRLATLPAELPDGRTLDKAADPWLLLGLVQSHFERLKDKRTFFSLLQHGVSIFLAWWSVPLTLFLLWIRFIPRHDGLMFWQIALLMCAVAVGIGSYRRAVHTLEGGAERPFSVRESLKNWRAYALGAIVTVVVGTVCVLVSVAALIDWTWAESETASITAVSPTRPHLEIISKRSRALIIRDSLLNADFSGEDVSTKPEGWTGDEDVDQIKLVKPAVLENANLRGANARDTFLVRARLAGTDFRGANLKNADLRGAILGCANLRGADLESAVLDGAILNGADLTEANLKGASLRGETWLARATLVGAVLDDADLEGAQLWNADLEGVRLLDVNMDHANLVQSNLKGAELTGDVSLVRTDLKGADTRGFKARPEYLDNAINVPADESEIEEFRILDFPCPNLQRPTADPTRRDPAAPPSPAP